MANLAIRPHVVEFLDVARAGQPGLRLEELEITEGSPLAGSCEWTRRTADQVRFRVPHGWAGTPVRRVE
jgi:hypothetical protein